MQEYQKILILHTSALSLSERRLRLSELCSLSCSRVDSLSLDEDLDSLGALCDGESLPPDNIFFTQASLSGCKQQQQQQLSIIESELSSLDGHDSPALKNPTALENRPLTFSLYCRHSLNLNGPLLYTLIHVEQSPFI